VGRLGSAACHVGRLWSVAQVNASVTFSLFYYILTSKWSLDSKNSTTS